MTEITHELEELGTNKRSLQYSLISDVTINKNIDNSEVIKTLVRVSLICFTFMALEFIGGYISDSVAVMSDALHLSIDIIGYVIQIISAYLAMKKSTKRHNFGFMRAESVGALLNCFTIWALTVYLLMEAIRRLYHPSRSFNPRVMLITSTFGVFANLMMAVAIHGWSILGYMVKYPCLSEQEKSTITFVDDGENLNIRAVMAHIMGDLVYSIGVWIAAIVINIRKDWQWIDSACTILFSFVVLHITVPVFKDSLRVIMEAVPQQIDRDELLRQVEALSDISKVRSFRIWSITQDQICATVHATIEKDTNEQLLQSKIAKILKEAGLKFWAIQFWKGN